MTAERPPVTVIAPFYGDRAAGERIGAALAGLQLRDGDEVLLSDNTPDHVLRGLQATNVAVVDASAQRSSYFARNVAIERARNDWLVLLDADCDPDPDLLDAYFAQPIGDEVGAVVGTVVAEPGQASLVARFSREWKLIDQDSNLANAHRPFAATANLLVRKAAWESVGGFHERIRSAGDADFSWRLQEASWSLDRRPRAVVRHSHRESVRPFVRQFLRYGAGHAWLDRRHGGAWPAAPVVRRVGRAAASSAGHLAFGRRERSGLRGLDALRMAALAAGRQLSNRAPLTAAERAATAEVAILCDAFSELSETFIAAEAHALRDLGAGVRVEATRRARRPNRAGSRGLVVAYAEDDGALDKLGATLALAARHPIRVVQDALATKRWRAEEHVPRITAIAAVARRLERAGVQHLHAHFAVGSALTAMRVGHILGLPFSVTAHAFDIYLRPANLREKLVRAAFATSGCEYTVRDLREIAGPGHADRVHVIVMGVDPDAFVRSTPYPGGRRVVAVGRLVEKKGFTHLLDALALLEASEPLEELRIVGAGPLDGPLREQCERLGLDDRVRFDGALDPPAVRAVLEAADLLVMPCIVAADGDRDSMPVVVKEALAMEIPVVVSDEVGLPEIVEPRWGALAPPGDAAGLADAIRSVLALPASERAAMGRAGRAFTIERCTVRGETQKLLELIRNYS